MSNICAERLLDPLAPPTVLSTVCHIIAAIEFPLHIVGAYCILAKTPKRMEKVKFSMLIMHISTVFMTFIMSVLVIPYGILPAIGGKGLGLLSWIGFPTEYQLYLSVTGPALTGISILAVYENRYYVLCDNRVWKKVRTCYIIFNYCCALSCWIYPVVQIPDQITARAILIDKYSCILVKSDIDINSITILTFNPMTVGGPMLAEIVMNFVQCFLLFILTYLFFTTKKTKLSISTYQMQKKFMIALLIQSTLFTLALCAPVSAFSLSMFSDSYDQGLNNLCIIILSLNASISTTAIILLHPPYREWAIGICIKTFRKSSQSTVSPSFVISTN